MLIDTHAHIYLPTYSNDISSVLDRAQEAGISHIFMPNIDESTVEPMVRLANEWHTNSNIKLYCMIGLHPGSIQPLYAKTQLSIIRTYLTATPAKLMVAIGEIGLDGTYEHIPMQLQIKILEEQLEWAATMKLPVVLHTRRAIDLTIDVVKTWINKGLKGVFHSFTGDTHQARQILDMGFKIGINGIVTFKKGGQQLRETLKYVPPDGIVIETDSPFLTPHPYRGKRNEPAMITYTFDVLCQIYGDRLTRETLKDVLKKNTFDIFDIIKR